MGHHLGEQHYTNPISAIWPVGRGRTAVFNTLPFAFNGPPGPRSKSGLGPAGTPVVAGFLGQRIFPLAAGFGFPIPARSAAPSDPGAAADPLFFSPGRFLPLAVGVSR